MGVEPTNDARLPWAVLVERAGPNSKGQKFYSGAATEGDAQALAAERNGEQPAEDDTAARFTYTVVAGDHPVVAAVRARR